MDTILASVTAISLGLAACMGVLLARLVREERRRSDARVAMLTELAAVERAGSPERRSAVRLAQSQASSVTLSPSAAVLDDFEIRPIDVPTAVGASIFQAEQQPSAWPMRLVAAAALVAVVAGVVFAWTKAHDAEPVTSTEVTAAPAVQPLELLSLAHQQQGPVLIVSGLVQNPRSATPLSRVQATVLAFDAGGKLLASGRAPLDFTTLAPGDESPFILRVTAEGATRYRVGFRGENDQALAHVDRRNLDALARKESP